MDPDQMQGLENHADHANFGDRLKFFGSLLFLPFLLVYRILCLVGKVDIRIGLAIIIGLRLVISKYVQTSGSLAFATLESKSIYSHSPMILDMNYGTRLAMFSQSELEEYGNVSHMNTQSFFWQSRKLDNEDVGTCPCSMPGFMPAQSKWEMTSNDSILVSLLSGIQWIEPHNCEIKPEALLVKDKLTSSSHCQITADEPEQLDDKMAGPFEATFRDHVKSVLKQRDIVDFLINDCWSFLALLVLFLDEMIWPMPDGIVGILVIMFLGLGMTGISWFEFPILMYPIAYSLMILSLILKCTLRMEWLSRLMAGSAYTSATLGILGIIVSLLPLQYARICVPILFFLLVLAVLCGCTSEVADQRRVGV